MEDIVTACRAPLFRLNVLAETKKNFPKVFSNDHIKKVRKLEEMFSCLNCLLQIVLSGPCTFSLFLLMKNLR